MAPPGGHPKCFSQVVHFPLLSALRKYEVKEGEGGGGGRENGREGRIGDGGEERFSSPQ